MDMDVALFEDRGIDAELGGVAFHQGQRSLNALAHYFAELTGQDQRSSSWRTRGFDKKNVAADRRPGQTGSYSRDAGTHGDFAFEARLAEDYRDPLLGEHNPVRAAIGDLDGDVAESFADLAFQIANTCFPCIPLDDEPQRVGVDPGLFQFQAVGIKLAANQIPPRDL